MSNKRKVFLCLFLSFALLAASFPTLSLAAAPAASFADVPQSHWAYKAIHDLRALKITDGVGNNNFGTGRTITRSEFVTFLVKLMKWAPENPVSGSYTDNAVKSEWYYSAVETAVKHGVLTKDSDLFRPADPITREEMAVMLVRTLGYDSLARQLTYLGQPFSDIQDNTGYITIARDLGIITGFTGNLFKPGDRALREQAAAMTMRMYEKLNLPLKELHAFYAIKSSPQKDFMNSLDSVSFGWSRLEYDSSTGGIRLNTTGENNNVFAVPDGFSGVVDTAKANNLSTQLMVFAEDTPMGSGQGNPGVSLLQYVLTVAETRAQVISAISEQADSLSDGSATRAVDGVVIDFEGMKGEVLKNSFNSFLSELSRELKAKNKKLYVMVHPARRPGLEYYNGYDFKTIGSIADKVILMAHDYDAKKLTAGEMQNGYPDTPPTPFDEVYYALRAITDKDTGVSDVSKVMLQLSFGASQWKLKDGKVINEYALAPEYASIKARLSSNVDIKYSDVSRNPYAVFKNDTDATDNILWYEDSRSVQDKINLAKMFGIQGISLWRLGIIPDYEEQGGKAIYLDIWQQILKAFGR